jgi:hypothetical protein
MSHGTSSHTASRAVTGSMHSFLPMTEDPVSAVTLSCPLEVRRTTAVTLYEQTLNTSAGHIRLSSDIPEFCTLGADIVVSSPHLPSVII